MIGKTGPSKAFRPNFSEEQERERILEEGLPMVKNGGTHYYGSQEEEGDQEEEEDEQEEEEQQGEQSPRTENPKSGNISKFLKIPRATGHRRGTDRVEALVDYSQSQKLTSDAHIAQLQNIAAKKQVLLELKEERQKEREENRLRKLQEMESKKLKRVEELEAKRLAKEIKSAQQSKRRRGRGKGHLNGVEGQGAVISGGTVGACTLHPPNQMPPSQRA